MLAIEALEQLSELSRVLGTYMVDAYLILVKVFLNLAATNDDRAQSQVCYATVRGRVCYTFIRVLPTKSKRVVRRFFVKRPDGFCK